MRDFRRERVERCADTATANLRRAGVEAPSESLWAHAVSGLVREVGIWWLETRVFSREQVVGAPDGGALGRRRSPPEVPENLLTLLRVTGCTTLRERSQDPGTSGKEDTLKKLLFVSAVLAMALTVSLPGAFARTDGAAAPKGRPGPVQGQILIGGTFPLTGPASLYAPIPAGMDAYFKWVNQRKGPDGKRGIYGRRIVWKYYDDGYNPANTVQLTNQLVLQDKVFAIVGTLGTEPNISIRPLLNQRKVPQVFVSTGASYWGLQYKQYPWTSGWQPDYTSRESRMGAGSHGMRRTRRSQRSTRTTTTARTTSGLIGLAAKRNLIARSTGYEITDTSYGSQIARQRASGADTWSCRRRPPRPSGRSRLRRR